MISRIRRRSSAPYTLKELMYRPDKSIPNPFSRPSVHPPVRPSRLSEMLLRDPPVVGRYRKRCAHTRSSSEIPFLPVVSYCVVCHVLYRSDCDRLHTAAVYLSRPPFPCLTTSSVVIKYISSADKCKMDDPSQLPRSWQLRYGKSSAAGCHRAPSIFSLRRKYRSGSRTIEAEHTIPSRKA